MKSIVGLVILPCLLIATANRSFALMEIDDVTKEQAKELGIAILSTTTGTNAVRVRIEFKSDGQLKGFSHAQLEMDSGGKTLSATLQPDRPTPDTVVVSFSADPATLSSCTVTIAVRHGERSMTGYRCKTAVLVDAAKSP